MTILSRAATANQLRSLSDKECDLLAQEIRSFIVDSVTRTGGHLGSNLGVVELTIALHRVFNSPRDVLLWDTGHQAYVHKILTGRGEGFTTLRQEGGLSGYPSRSESEHDWIENSHASTVLSYAYGIASAFKATGEDRERRVVAVIGDGALTGGMAYEALNNLGHSGRRVLIVLNDNGRSYAPTISHLSRSLTQLRLHPTYRQTREKIRHALRRLPRVGKAAELGLQGISAGLREVVSPTTFFEALGVRYVGPVDGHSIKDLEEVLAAASEWDGPIVVHAITSKGSGYAPAEDDEVQRLHDVKATPGAPTSNAPGELSSGPAATYTEAFTRALIKVAAQRPEVVALTAAMPGPTGLLPFQARFKDRYFDVGIAEQHEVGAAAGMAMGGLRPVVAVYSTFLSRAFDQLNLDVGLHKLPVVFALDRAGITGDDGPSHHGIFDMVLALAVPGCAVFAPSSAEDLENMLAVALDLGTPVTIRYPKTPPRHVDESRLGHGLKAKKLASGDGTVAILAVGKMVGAAEEALSLLKAEGISATLYDVRIVRPADEEMLKDASTHHVVITIEDGLVEGGAGHHLINAMALFVSGHGPAVHSLGVPTEFFAQAKPTAILHRLGLDAEGIAASVKERVGQALLAPEERTKSFTS